MAHSDFTTPRLFVEAPLVAGCEVLLDKGQSNYLRNVLRLATGDAVLVFNGRDGEWRAGLIATGRSAALQVEAPTRVQPAGPDVVYGFALLKHARLDYLVQKAVEMGAGILQPLLTQRTQVTRVNLDRMRANVVEASEQCGVLHVPEVRDAVRLDAFVDGCSEGRLLVFCDEEAAVADPLAALRQAAPDGVRPPLALVIGPEGGFDARERTMLLRHARVVRLSLGPRILRADTAAVAALAVIQSVLGDWRDGPASV